MKYTLEQNGHIHCVLQEGIDEFWVGYIYPLKGGLDGPKFSVRESCNNEVAVVKLMDEAIPALAAYYEEHLPWWQREGATYIDGEVCDLNGKKLYYPHS
jgi:hypothetical protein